MPKPNLTARFVILLSILLIAGCNTSRYGLRHDEVLPSIKRVTIVPLAVAVFSRHTGGIAEDRQDVTSEVLPRLIENLSEIIREKGRHVSQERVVFASSNAKQHADAAALAGAVHSAIRLHHYDIGKDVYMDYSLGETIWQLARSESDAVVLVSLQGAIPTGGRVGLAVTAFLVSALTGIQIHVSTNEAYIQLMLVNRDGDVLWYNQAFAKLDVRSESGLRRFVRKSSSHLLRIHKKKR